MTLIRDADTDAQKFQSIIHNTGLSYAETFIMCDEEDVSIEQTNCVVVVTTMPHGCLRYHEKFFSKNKNKSPVWIILLLNSNNFVHSQVDNFFSSLGKRFSLISIDENCDYSSLNEFIKRKMRIKQNKLLIYSVRPNCGKNTLKECLCDSLQGWEIELAEESKNKNVLAETDAGNIIIVGKSFSEFNILIPKDIKPLYVVTMLDQNVQTYLNRDKMYDSMLKYIPAHLKWTKRAVEENLFYISPLYEKWRKNSTDPGLDSRFVMWDCFGLPVLREEYTSDNVVAFLEQFNQCDKLVEKLLKNT